MTTSNRMLVNETSAIQDKMDVIRPTDMSASEITTHPIDIRFSPTDPPLHQPDEAEKRFFPLTHSYWIGFIFINSFIDIKMCLCRKPDDTVQFLKRVFRT